MPNQMQGHCRKVLKVSTQSTSVENFVEELDNGTPPVLPAVVKAASYQQLTRGHQRIGTLAPWGVCPWRMRACSKRDRCDLRAQNTLSGRQTCER